MTPRRSNAEGELSWEASAGKERKVYFPQNGYYSSNINIIIRERGVKPAVVKNGQKKTKEQKKTHNRKKPFASRSWLHLALRPPSQPGGKEKCGKRGENSKKKTPTRPSLEKAIRLHLALRGGVAPPHPPFAPAYRPVIGSIIINKEPPCPENRQKRHGRAKRTELRKKNRRKKTQKK